jgi:hypothetical protein
LRRKLWRILSALIILIFAKQVVAQTPAASGPPAKDEQGSGMTLNTAFSGSVASGGDVFDWTTAAGYVFNKHFSADVGVPILFVRGTTSTGTTTSSNGLGKNPRSKFWVGGEGGFANGRQLEGTEHGSRYL